MLFDSFFSFLPNVIMAVRVNANPQNINAVGISEYIRNPNINAAEGSAPDNNIDEIPDSI